MKITIPGEPIPKARPRFFVKGGKRLAYNSQSTLESEMAWKLKKACQEAKFDHSAVQYEIDLRFYFRPPPDKECSAKLWGLIDHVQKPDLDNLEKFILDCANGILYIDDAQIVRLSSSKHYSTNPRTEITIVTKKQPDVTPEIKQLVKHFSPDELEEFVQDVQVMQTVLEAANLALSDDLEDVPIGRLEPAAKALTQFCHKYWQKIGKIAKS
jgi:Holliday junction resolvase RusA-like endonuclease